MFFSDVLMLLFDFLCMIDGQLIFEYGAQIS